MKNLRDGRNCVKIISGENNDVDDNDRRNWITGTLSKILKDYKTENIFIAHDTALFFECLPQKTLHIYFFFSKLFSLQNG